MDEWIQYFQDTETIQDEIDLEDSLQNTPLLIAAERGHASVVEKLLGNKANIMKINLKGKSALQLAMDEGHKPVISAILESKVWKEALR